MICNGYSRIWLVKRSGNSYIQPIHSILLMKAFVLATVGTRSGLIEGLNAVRGVGIVKEAYLIWGPYDLLCKVEVSSLGQLNTLLDVMYDSGFVDSNTMVVNDEGGLSYELPDCDKVKKCAYILIKKRRPGAPRLWEKYLRNIEDILEAHELFGMWDVIVGVREEAREEFFDRVFKKLWLLTEVNLTSTHTVFTLKL